jgi:hypothetical protein
VCVTQHLLTTDNPEKLTTLGTQDTGRRPKKNTHTQKTQHRKQKKKKQQTRTPGVHEG